VSYSEWFPIFGAQYSEFGAKYFLSLSFYEQPQQPADASRRFTCFRQWRITAGRKETIASQIQNTARKTSETVRNRTHIHINFFLRMTDTMTSQNIDLSSWDTLYKVITVLETLRSPVHVYRPGNWLHKRRCVSIAPVVLDRNSKYS
jgi:hypothetical protein